MSKMTKCHYCNIKMENSYYRDHLEYSHGKELRASLHRMKIALPLILVSFSFVLGMIWMGLIN